MGRILLLRRAQIAVPLRSGAKCLIEAFRTYGAYPS